MNLDAEQIVSIPVDPLIADKTREQQPEVRVPLVSTSSDDGLFPPLQQPQLTKAPFDFESPPETYEQQYAWNERKIRARSFQPKRKSQKISIKSQERNQQQKQKLVRGFRLKKSHFIKKTEEIRTNLAKLEHQAAQYREMHKPDWNKKKNEKQ